MENWKTSGKWSDDDDWDYETGAPKISHFSNAVQVWSILQERPTTIADAALAFNVPTERIYEAVEEHYWMFVGGDGEDASKNPVTDTIEHEGE